MLTNISIFISTQIQVVRIAGNNRTKASLIGLEAKVRRSTGLGGWHFLVLPSGEEIKLQRNALIVLEYPTGLEAESSASEGERHKPATPHIPRYGPILETQRLPAKRPRPVSTLPSDFVDGSSRRVSLRQQYAGIGPSSMGNYNIPAVDHAPPAAYEPHHVNFDKLQTKTLRKYLTTYNLNTTSITREAMVQSAQRHFAGVEVSEEDLVRKVLDAARRNAY
jgi:Sin3 binding region of histone deacetylase complex subunit SAP30